MVRILISGGGTLGSVSPLMAIKESVPEADYLFVGTKHGIEREFVIRHQVRYKYIGTVKFRRYFSLHNVIDLVKLPFVFLQALIIVAQYRPHIVLTSGSFVSVPVAYAARLFGCTIFLHQQDIALGLANRLIMRIATVITTTFESQVKEFPQAKAQWIGNPTRLSAAEKTTEKQRILVLGGSTGAQGLNRAMAQVLPHFVEHFDIIHVLGTRNYYQRLSLGPRYTAVQFLGDDYAQQVRDAAVVITRAGMSTVTELAYYAKAAVLIPMPNSHQEVNANFFEQNGAALVAKQSDSYQIRRMIERLLTDTAKRARLGAQLHSLFPTDANQRYAALLRSYFPAMPKTKPVAYFVGIGGIGISAIAAYFIEQGYQVVGSDLHETEVTRRLKERGALIHYDHRRENVPAETELLIYSTAVPLTNEEIMEAQRRHRAVYSYKQYLGLLSAKQTTVAVSGTHGKTTTTAMTGLVLKDGGLDPTIIVGAFIPQLEQKNYHAGKSQMLVVEADEYRSDMLLLHPTIAVLTNIDLDHLDFYRDIDDITEHFQRFVDLVPEHGLVVINHDDERLVKLRTRQRISYGFSDGADYQATDLRVEPGRQTFTVRHQGVELGRFELRIPGRFNISNAMAAIAVARKYQVPVPTIQRSIAAFRGTWRRFEYLGIFKGATVYSDYGHHPTAIQSTIQAAKGFYPKKRLVLVFQPHSYDRTEKLFEAFSRAFIGVDELLLVDIYDVAGRDQDKNASSKALARAVQGIEARYIGSRTELRTTLDEMITQDDLLLIMGAGDIDSFARSLI